MQAMLPRKRLPAAWAVLAVALAFLFILVSAVTLIAWNSYQDAMDRARSRVSSATQVVANHIEWLTAASLLVMEETNRLVGADITDIPAQAGVELALHLRHMPPGVSVSLADPADHVVYSTASGSLLKLQPISEDSKSAMAARIAAMSALHEQAYRSDQYSEVDLRGYLLSLVDSIRRTSPETISFETNLAEAMVERDLAQPLGLIANEVISNAVKHAFADGANGTGFLPSGQETGMGSRLIRAFAQQLGNDYGYASDNGTRFAIRFAARRGGGSQ